MESLEIRPDIQVYSDIPETIVQLNSQSIDSDIF
jgi:hypothetical protein